MNNWQRRLLCPLRHCGFKPDGWQQGDADEYYWIVQANSRITIKARCCDCGQKSSSIPFTVWERWYAQGARLNPQPQVNAPHQYEPCSVRGCITVPTEYHHFAPYNTFGPDADNWPCLPLCRPHHTHWHKTMDGYRWHAKAAA